MKDSDADKLIQCLLADAMTPDEVEALDRWLCEDPANARLLAEHGLLEQLMVTAQQEHDASAVLELLLELERAAEPIVLMPKRVQAPSDEADDPNALSGHELVVVGRYLLGKVLTSRPALYAYAAAVVLLVGALLIPWGDSNPSPQTAQTNTNNTKPAASAQPTPRGSTPQTAPGTAPVATLTATHNATWAPGPGPAASAARANPPTPGTPLHPNQRLTLTAGFAEITTARGAVAILEAPATIELLDNDNALHLEAGKLVGTCETEQSHGFVVRTPHMDITDLGTRFGVDVDPRTATRTTVFEGEVAVAPAKTSSSAQTKTNLLAGQSIAYDTSGQRIEDANGTTSTFDRLSMYSAAVASITGQATWLANPQTNIDSNHWSSDNLCVFEEPGPFTLTADVPLALHRKGFHRIDSLDPSSHSVVPAGSTVRSFIVVLKPDAGIETIQRQATLQFAGRILGVITNAEESNAFFAATDRADRLFTPAPQRYHDPWPGESDADTVTIKDDRRSAVVSLHTAKGGYDMIRVLVEADQP